MLHVILKGCQISYRDCQMSHIDMKNGCEYTRSSTCHTWGLPNITHRDMKSN